MSKSTSFRQRVAAVAGATALIVAGGVATAGTAAAGPNCPSGYHCLFSGTIDENNRVAFFNTDYDFTNNYFTDGRNVNDAAHSASNSSNSGYESHYYKDINHQGGLLFCVNPGSSVDDYQLEHSEQDGDGWGQAGEASSLRVRSTTPTPCF